jgi:hypothetical protein
MPGTADQPEPSPITPDVRAREMADLVGVLASPFTQDSLDSWVAVSPHRPLVLRDTFFGRIRWPKSLGRPIAAQLSDGFLFRLRNYFVLYYVGIGGEVIEKRGFMDMPAPVANDVPDDTEHYKVVFSGYYAKLSTYVERNELMVTIVGAWSNPENLAGRYLTVDPLGYDFGAFDGSPIVLDEMTVIQHWTPNQPRFSAPIGK